MNPISINVLIEIISINVLIEIVSINVLIEICIFIKLTISIKTVIENGLV